jgi:hypothetical protein
MTEVDLVAYLVDNLKVDVHIDSNLRVSVSLYLGDNLISESSDKIELE